VGRDPLAPGRPIRPITLTAGQIRPLVDGNCGIDISCVAQPDHDRHAETLHLRLELPGYLRLVDVRAGGLA
jgi:hypothetical protein